MSREFNHQQAWTELANPYYEQHVSQQVKDLLATLAREYPELRQDASLDVPIPESVGAVLETIETAELALAACVVYFWGHWAHCNQATVYYPKLEPKLIEAELFLDSEIKKYLQLMNGYGDPEGEIKIEYHRKGPPQDWGGVTWKFSNMADQVLRKRLGLPPQKSERYGITYGVHEGKLRIQYSSSSNWLWEELGWATPETLAQSLASSYSKSHHDFPQLKAELVAKQPWADWFMDQKFMDHKPGTKWELEELPQKYQHVVQGSFEILDCRAVNFKPHPFMIGAAHFPKDGIYINTERAGCAYRERPGSAPCGLPYAKHTYDKVMFLRAARNLGNQEAAGLLFALKTALEEGQDVIDGFAFVKSDFTIAPPEDAGDENPKKED